MSKFDELSKRWDSGKNQSRTALSIYRAMADALKFTKQMNVADIGAGTGLLLFNIQPYVKQITAYDNSEGMLEVLDKKRKQLRAENVSIQKADMDITPLPENTYHCIVSSMTLHHIEDVSQFFASAYKSLLPGGILALADLEPEDGSFHSKPDEVNVKHYGFNPEEFSGKMEKVGFRNCSQKRIHTIKKESGEYPVFLAVGKKT